MGDRIPYGCSVCGRTYTAFPDSHYGEHAIGYGAADPPATITYNASTCSGYGMPAPAWVQAAYRLSGASVLVEWSAEIRRSAKAS